MKSWGLCVLLLFAALAMGLRVSLNVAAAQASQEDGFWTTQHRRTCESGRPGEVLGGQGGWLAMGIVSWHTPWESLGRPLGIPIRRPIEVPMGRPV